MEEQAEEVKDGLFHSWCVQRHDRNIDYSWKMLLTGILMNTGPLRCRSKMQATLFLDLTLMQSIKAQTASGYTHV